MADASPTLAGSPIDSARLELAIMPAPGGWGAIRMLRTFWVLQPGAWYEWLGIWLLQNLRFAPIYVLPLLTGKLIDSIDRSDPGKAYAWMPVMIGAAAVMCVVNVIGDTISRLLQSRIARGLTAGLRDALIKRLNRLTFGFHDREHLGQIEARFTLDMNRMEGFLGFLSDAVLMNASVLLVMAAIIFWTNPLLLPVVALGAGLNLVLARVLWSRLRTAQESYRRAEGSFLHRLGETLRGLRIARAHATEEFTEERLRTDVREVARRGMMLDMLINFFGSSSWAIGTLLNTGMVMFGVWLTVTTPHRIGWGPMSLDVHPITIGQLTVLLSYYGIMAGALAGIVNQVPTISGAHDALRSLSDLYHDETEPITGGIDPGRIAGELRLAGVRFAYPGAEHPVLNDLHLEVQAGTSVALVGPSGGGKSTIASLVLGFYHAQHGTVTVDGHDLHALDLRALRRQVGVVNQELVLFNDTLLRNIAWGDRVPDERRAREAARMANALEFIEKFPAGLYHVLGDRGSGLSGGQRQRLAIARALYRDPRILILDEATSALDTASERLVQDALATAMNGRTTIIIAHRLSTIRDVDQVAVVAEGRIVERGSYAELAAAGGVFTSMVNPDHQP